MSAVATTTSFEELVQNIELGSRSSSTNSYSDCSTYDGSNDSSPRKWTIYSPRDSGVFMGTSESPTHEHKQQSDGTRSGHGHGSQEVAQHHLSRRIDTNVNPSVPSFYSLNREIPRSPRSRAGSTASSVNSNNFSVRHNLERKGSVRDPARPVALSRILHETGVQPNAHLPPARSGCILSSVGEMANIRAVTLSGLLVWWCRFDNMVVFDGMIRDADTGTFTPMTRSSKGLPIANAKGMVEIVRFKLDCDHCKEILRLTTWKYAARVCKRGVCAACRVKCVQEHERMVEEASKASTVDEELGQKSMIEEEANAVPSLPSKTDENSSQPNHTKELSPSQQPLIEATETTPGPPEKQNDEDNPPSVDATPPDEAHFSSLRSPNPPSRTPSNGAGWVFRTKWLR